MPDSHSPTLLVISQVYVPDPAAVGQYMHDAAAAMAARGWRVVVLTSARGYDDPSVRYPARQVVDGVHIRRLPLSSFGKKNLFTRLTGQGLFLLQTIAHGLFLARLRAILVSTSPPMASIAALAVRALHLWRAVAVKFWLMDLNPDQAVALGKFRPGALPVRMFDWLNRRLYGAAADIIVLDRFMKQRVLAKRADVESKITILPPWALEDHLEPLPHESNPFRDKHHLADKFVFMYSGNMSIASPLTTILQAALRVQEDERLVFMFIGGGLGRREVEETIRRHQPRNLTLLPYQPLAELRYSLSAADVHLVTLGDNMVGMIHPCKIYGAMAVARPMLYVGPSPSHIADLLQEHRIGWQVSHADVDGAVAAIRHIAAATQAELAAMGRSARTLLDERLSKSHLREQFARVLERGTVSRP